MRKLVVLILTCVSFSLSAQVLPIYYDTIADQQEIVLTGNGEISASAILQETSSKFYRGGLITEEMITRSLDRHKAVNRVGFDLSSELVYRSNKVLLKKWDLSYQVVAGTYYFGGMRYSKDLFDLAMNGNAGFKGDTADFSGTDINFTAFQKVGFGFVSKKSRSFLNFNVYNIQDRIDMNMRDGSLSVSSEADTLGLTADFTLSTKSNKQFNQGIGFGVDFTYYMPIEWKEDRQAFIEFQIKNLGFGYMYEAQRNYQADTSITFSGFRFNELFGDQAINFDSLNVMDTLGIREFNSNPTFLLPGFIQVAKIIDEHNDSKVQSFFGLRLYPTLNFSPLAFAGLDWKANDWMHLGLNASYGGFAKFRGGIYASAAFDKWRIGLGSENIIGLFYGKGNGVSANFRLSCAF